jgi:uncharacterized protein (DUF924 family)
MGPRDVLTFWFGELSPDDWFKRDPVLDRKMALRFKKLHAQACLGELCSWRESIEGRLAEILLLDQFSRNIFRDDPRSFAQDGMALVLAQEMVSRGMDKELGTAKRSFVYMPYMHSESVAVHHQALKLFAAPGLEHNLDYEKAHLAILRKFGRFPHRNKILNRASTPEEIEFLKGPNSSF